MRGLADLEIHRLRTSTESSRLQQPHGTSVCRGNSSVMASFVASNTDPELSQCLRWASESGSTLVFARTVVEAARMACLPDYAQLRSA